MNYKYGRFINGVFEYAPKILKKEGQEIINPTEEQYLEFGYKKIVYTPCPQKEGYYYTSKIINKSSIPTQKWEEHKIENQEE